MPEGCESDYWRFRSLIANSRLLNPSLLSTVLEISQESH
jgi:hypothetical protein